MTSKSPRTAKKSNTRKAPAKKKAAAKAKRPARNHKPVEPEAPPQEPQAEIELRQEVKKLGRPTLYRPEMCDLVRAYGTLGMEVVEFASELGVQRNALYEWAKTYPEFGDALTEARELAEGFHVRRIRDQLGRAGSTGNASAYLNYMARRYADWRDKQDVNLEGEASLTVKIVRQGGDA